MPELRHRLVHRDAAGGDTDTCQQLSARRLNSHLRVVQASCSKIVQSPAQAWVVTGITPALLVNVSLPDHLVDPFCAAWRSSGRRCMIRRQRYRRPGQPDPADDPLPDPSEDGRGFAARLGLANVYADAQGTRKVHRCRPRDDGSRLCHRHAPAARARSRPETGPKPSRPLVSARLVARAQARRHHGRHLCRRADRAGAAQGGCGVCAGGSLRAPAGAAVARHRGRPVDPLLLPWLGLCALGQVRRRAVSRQGQAAQRRARLSVPRAQRPDPGVPGRSRACRRGAAAGVRRRRRRRLQDPAVRPRHRLPLQLHAREPDGHEPSVHARQADGPDPPALPGPGRRRYAPNIPTRRCGYAPRAPSR